jgi:hypothetical protein
MKKQIRSLAQIAIALILIMVTIISCQKDTNVPIQNDDEYMDLGGEKVKVLLSKNTKNDSYVLNTSMTLEDKTILPKGTRFEKVPGDPSTFLYTLPEGYTLIGKSGARQQTMAATAGKVTCTCTSGSGCSPYIADFKQNTTGCLMGNGCDQCTKKTSARIGVSEAEITESEIIDLNKGISFATEDAEIAKLPCSTALFLSSEIVQTKLREFIQAYQLKNTEELYKAKSIEEMPSNYEMVVVNVFGRSLLVPVDATVSPLLTNRLTNGGVVSRARLAAGVTCKCESGTSGCTKGAYSIPFVGSVVYCEAGRCQSCSIIK